MGSASDYNVSRKFVRLFQRSWADKENETDGQTKIIIPSATRCVRYRNIPFQNSGPHPSHERKAKHTHNTRYNILNQCSIFFKTKCYNVTLYALRFFGFNFSLYTLYFPIIVRINLHTLIPLGFVLVRCYKQIRAVDLLHERLHWPQEYLPLLCSQSNPRC